MQAQAFGGFKRGGRNGHRGGSNRGGSRGGFRGNGRSFLGKGPSFYRKQNEQRKHVHNNNLDMTAQMASAKGELIDYLYSQINLSRYKYKILEEERDLPLLQEQKMYVSPTFNGIQGFLIFKRIKDKFYSLIIDRRSLQYTKPHDVGKIKIIPVNVRLDESIYNGTIIEGVLLYNNYDQVKNFMINDIFIFRGQNLIDDQISHKFQNMTSYLEAKWDKNDDGNNINFVINNLHPLSEIRQLIDVYIPKSKYALCIKGVSFTPEVTRMKLIYLFSNCAATDDTSDGGNTQDTVVRKSNVQVDTSDVTAVLRMKKTDNVDVYELSAANKIIKDGKTLLKYKKLGIAYVTTSQCSHFCNDVFENTTEDSVLVTCVYLSDCNKWVPSELAMDKKRPDYIEEIQKITQCDVLS